MAEQISPLVGLTGRVTGPVVSGTIGEVMLSVRGGAEAHLAEPYYPDQAEIEIGKIVRVVEAIGRKVYVVLDL